MSTEKKLVDSFNEGGRKVNLFNDGSTPDKNEFFNFLQIAVADRVFGGAMDPEKGGGWRSEEGLETRTGKQLGGFNLKDFVLGSGGKSKESYASILGIDEAVVDTVEYQDALNYEFIIGSEEIPDMITETSEGSSLGDPDASVFANIIDEYTTAFLKKEGGDDPFFEMNDERSDKYDSFMKTVTKKLDDEGVEGFLQDPFWQDAFQKYSEAFGSQ